MKRIAAFLVVLAMLFTGGVCAASGLDLAVMSPEELQQLIADAEKQLQMSEEALMQSAVQLLTDHWKNEVYASEYMAHSDGYLEILAAQIVYVKEDYAVQEELASQADAMFENVYCVVDFVLLTDHFGSSPYYWDAGVDNCVVIYRDGTMEFSRLSLFSQYRSRTYSSDFSAIIDRVERYDLGENNVWYLNEN